MSDVAGREMTTREHLEQITQLLDWVKQPSKLMDARNHAWMALKKIDDVEAALRVLYEFAGIGTERPPEHVFAFFRDLHGIEPIKAKPYEPGDAAPNQDWTGPKWMDSNSTGIERNRTAEP